MKRLITLSHPMVDILVRCEHALLSKFNLTPGTYGMLDRAGQDTLIAACDLSMLTITSGGSAANSAACAGLLGVATTFMGLAGEDRYGQLFHAEFEKIGVTISNAPVAQGRTGTCVSLITPDSERTMRTHLGIGSQFSQQDLDNEAIAQSEWLLLEGYFLTGSEENRLALHRAIDIARTTSTKIALSASAEFVITAKKQELLEQVLPKIDLLFANEREALLITDSSSSDSAFLKLSQLVSGLVMTVGQRGAVVKFQGERFHQPAFISEITAIDSTGAGDAFAGAFLAGLAQDLPAKAAARGAARLAAAVVSQLNSRVPLNAKELFIEAVKGI